MSCFCSEILHGSLMPSKPTVWMASESNPDVSYLTCHFFPSCLLEATAFYILGPYETLRSSHLVSVSPWQHVLLVVCLFGSFIFN